MLLNLVVDMYGCPNRCRHCWLGHMPNKRMEADADRFIVDYFDPYFDRIAYYSWLREPDYCDDYRSRWQRDLQISKNARPVRFELASFYRLVRDEDYIPFLKETGVQKVQLTFFGLKETQDRYVGSKGAYEEVLEASDRLWKNGIIPRWQCFINEENKDEIVQIYAMAMKIKAESCPPLEFFVHEGSCDGENRKLYPLRINKEDIPEILLPVYLNYDELLKEKECCEMLKDDHDHPLFLPGEEITLNIANNYDVYYNYTQMSKPWVIGNLKTLEAKQLTDKIINGDTFALNEARKVSWAQLVRLYGDLSSDKVFSLDDYKMYLFNNYLDEKIC